MIFKDFFYEVLELFISSKLSRQNFAVQSVAYCHKDSLFKDKVKPIRLTHWFIYFIDVILVLFNNIFNFAIQRNVNLV